MRCSSKLTQSVKTLSLFHYLKSLVVECVFVALQLVYAAVSTAAILFKSFINSLMNICQLGNRKEEKIVPAKTD